MKALSRRAFTLTETLVALSIGLAVVTIVLGVFQQSNRIFFRSQASVDLQAGARLILESMGRDVASAHLIRPPDEAIPPVSNGRVLRLIRYLSDDERDHASRRTAAYIDGATTQTECTKSFAAQEVVYAFDRARRTIDRTQTDGVWSWRTDRLMTRVAQLRFSPSSSPSTRRLASDVKNVWIDYFGFNRQRRLDRVTNLAASEANLAFAGTGDNVFGSTALVLVRLVCGVDQPAGRMGEEPVVDLVTKMWCERRHVDAFSRQCISSADETPARD